MIDSLVEKDFKFIIKAFGNIKCSTVRQVAKNYSCWETI